MAASYDATDTMFMESKKGYKIISVAEAAKRLETMDEFALDFETTSLRPEHGKIRITSIYNNDHHFIVDHMYGGSFEALLPALRGKIIWVYHAKFEADWCDYHADKLGWDFDELLDIRDVDYLAKSKLGGGPSSLAIMCKRDLGIILSKEEQLSDWSAPNLSTSQLDYAAFDSFVTWKLRDHWFAETTPEQREAGIFVFNSAVRGTVEAERTGLYLDSEYHDGTVGLWELKQETFERCLVKRTPPDVIANLRSDVQISEFLYGILDEETLANWPKTGKRKHNQKCSEAARGKPTLQLEGKYLRSVSRQFSYPFSRWLAALAGFKYYNKYLSTYGDKLLTKAALAGKVHSRFNIAQAATGRYSSAAENLQNIPRKTVVRKAFYSPDVGELLMCLADYKGIEIRTLGEISGDEQLVYDATYSDVHAASAAAIYGHELQYVLDVLASEGKGKYANIYPIIKEQRSKAKGFTFQLLYGAGPGALSDVLKCTFDEAVEAIQAWANRYPNAYNYRNVMFDAMNTNGGFLPIWSGRTVYVHKNDRTLPVAANYGVQGAAADVMYRAMYRCHELFSKEGINAWLAATVHDEILTYAETEDAERAMELQIEGMRLAWLDIFPGTNTDNLVDWAIGADWSAKP